MSKSVAVAYTGDTFYPPPDSKYVHDGHEYTIGELMHMEIKNGSVISHVRAHNTTQIVYFCFECDLSAFRSRTEEDNVHQLHPPQQARA